MKKNQTNWKPDGPIINHWDLSMDPFIITIMALVIMEVTALV